ncbi:hypothetical protein BD309DRAFT_968479 [Dichomitus squalens]|nr:hypothetical protein BD309DRAFT_968479 [Dichomitus squalens]
MVSSCLCALKMRHRRSALYQGQLSLRPSLEGSCPVFRGDNGRGSSRDTHRSKGIGGAMVIWLFAMHAEQDAYGTREGYHCVKPSGK